MGTGGDAFALLKEEAEMTLYMLVCKREAGVGRVRN